MKMRTLAALFLGLTFAAAAIGQDKQEKTVKIEKKIIRQECPGGAAALTEDQQKKAEAIEMETQKAVAPIEAQIGIKEAELKALIITDKPDKAAIDKKIEEIGALRVQVQKKHMAGKLEVRAMLTPDQRVGFDRRFGREGGCGMGCGRMEGGPGMGGRPGRGLFPAQERPEHIRIMRHMGDCPDAPNAPECPNAEKKIEIETK
jgi:zinc resistance-associated protein